MYQAVGDYLGAWKELEQALKSGKVCAIGISDFDITDEILNSLVEKVNIKPQIFQIECHPYAQRDYWHQMAKKTQYKSRILVSSRRMRKQWLDFVRFHNQ
ncbi:MAG: hypothetical protein IJT36_02755 [Alphaproteobacteria bacterium]|nr:hypothetical protein [Alphaproteobacteria bacterium]